MFILSENIIELKKEKDDEEESMLISGGGSGKNSEYEKMVNFLNKKEEIIKELWELTFKM